MPGWSTSFSRGDGSTHRQAPHAVAHEYIRETRLTHLTHTMHTESPYRIGYCAQKRVRVGPNVHCTLYLPAFNLCVSHLCAQRHTHKQDTFLICHFPRGRALDARVGRSSAFLAKVVY